MTRFTIDNGPIDPIRVNMNPDNKPPLSPLAKIFQRIPYAIRFLVAMVIAWFIGLWLGKAVMDADKVDEAERAKGEEGLDQLLDALRKQQEPQPTQETFGQRMAKARKAKAKGKAKAAAQKPEQAGPKVETA